MKSVNKKKITVSVTNDLVTDNRVNKVCSKLESLGFSTTLVGRKLPNSMPFQKPYKGVRFSLFFKSGGFFYAEYNLRLFFYLLFTRQDVLLANDLDTLLPNYLVSKIKGIPLVYDTHEYFLGVPEIQGRWVKNVWAIIEKFIFPKLETVFTVNDSIANLYFEDYGKRPLVFRNIGEVPLGVKSISREEIGIPNDAFLLINQGSGINVDRGMEEAFEAIKNLLNVHIMLVGDGDAIPGLKKLARDLGIIERIHFFGKRPYAELLAFTKIADAGLTLDKPTNINYKFSLPNKLFDYIHSGLPVISSQVVEVKKIVETYKIGEVVDSQKPSSIESGILRLMQNTKKPYEKGLETAAKEFTWEEESKMIVNVYQRFLPSS